MDKGKNWSITSIGLDTLGAPKKSEVSRPGVGFSGASGNQFGTEMISGWGPRPALIGVDREIAGRVVRSLHPNLAQMRVSALTFRVRIGDYDFHSGQ